MSIEPAAHDRSELLARENARLQRIVETLMDRVERTTESANSPFGFFQINAALAEQVAQQKVALRDSEQTLQVIFDTAPVGLFLFDPELRLLRVNDCANAILGHCTQEMVGRCVGNVVRCPNAAGAACGQLAVCQKCVLRHLLEEARKSNFAQCEHELALFDGPDGARRSVWVSLKADSPVVAGRQHLLLIMDDISIKKQAVRELEKAKEMAEEASRLKSRFLSNVSHEIRTPLNGIMGFAEAIVHGASLETACAHADIILRESSLLLMLVNDLLDLVKIESGKLVLEQVPVDLAELLREVSQTAGMQARAKGLGFVATIAVDVPSRIMADPLRLRQILLNLVSNAVKFTERGEVRVSVERIADAPESGVRISVRDTGIGISHDKQEVIFEAFSQADVSTTRKYGGTGLGLTIVRQLVALMGGELGLESVPAQGSTFCFSLPAEVAPETGPTGPAAGSSPVEVATAGRPGRILFAEDYPTNQQVARLFLEQAGHEVTVVSNGRAAVESCATACYDLILMDLHMPVMDGMTATVEIRNGVTANRTVPIVALTASADPETQATCLRSGFSGLLTKPIRRQALLTAVEHWLEQGPRSDPGPHPAVAGAAGNKNLVAVPPIDLATAIDEFGGGPKVACLLRDFLDQAGVQLASMEYAAKTGQRDALRQAAHALRGAAATLEAAPLASIAARLEALSAEAVQADLLPLVDALTDEFRRLTAYSQDHMRSLENPEHAQPGC